MYLMCCSEDFLKICSTQEDKCYFKKRRINATQIQKHINAPYSKLIVVDKHKEIHHLILELMGHNR